MADVSPLALYVHFPWCVAKCPYCDFNSHSLRGEMPADEYVDALLLDLASSMEHVCGRPLESVFLGGGTPSLFTPCQIARLLAGVADRLELIEGAEITLEANPGAVEHGAFSGYLEAGVNRLSLGVQSFSDRLLAALGRIHDASAAATAYREARAAGFTNINLDLMFALPGQTADEAVADVQAAIALGPEHISYYHLTLEPNTVFYARPPRLPDVEQAWDIQEAGHAALAAAGYRQYEVSAWCREPRECRHNLNYWKFGDYLGIGAGAHAKVTRQDGRVIREKRAAHPREYLHCISTGRPPGEQSLVADHDLAFEFALNALRLRGGFSAAEFTARTGLAPRWLLAGVEEALEKQLLSEVSPGCWRATELGWRFLDDLQAIFLPRNRP